MRSETQAFLTSIDSCPWFTAVGQRIASRTIERVTSWSEAAEFCFTLINGDNFLRARNALTMGLFHRSKKAYKSLPAFSNDVCPLIDALVPEKFDHAVRHSTELRTILEEQPDWHDLLAGSITGNLAAICLNIEYGHVVCSRYFTRAEKLYLAGHFPCGWRGTFPEGSMVVF